ncbi:MAG: magnesium transporter [Paracoccaceae bacterium]|jgi:magnesium transporter
MSDFNTDISATCDASYYLRRVNTVRDALGLGNAARLTRLLDPLHAADIADIAVQLSSWNRRKLIDVWECEIDGGILSEIDKSIRGEVIDHLPHHVLAGAVRELDANQVADILKDIEKPQQAIILEALADADCAAVGQVLASLDLM